MDDFRNNRRYSSPQYFRSSVLNASNIFCHTVRFATHREPMVVRRASYSHYSGGKPRLRALVVIVWFVMAGIAAAIQFLK